MRRGKREGKVRKKKRGGEGGEEREERWEKEISAAPTSDCSEMRPTTVQAAERPLERGDHGSAN